MDEKEKETQAALARVVQKLLKKLPGADPHLRGDQARVNVSAVPDVPHAKGPQPPTARDRLAVWGRVALALVLAVVVNQWPYGVDCGWSLFFYMGALMAVTVAGVWGALSTWHRRMGLAHILALLVVVWGGLLTLDRILPRVGYAAVPANWTCVQAAGKI